MINESITYFNKSIRYINSSQTDDNLSFHNELHFHFNIILLREILNCDIKQRYKNDLLLYLQHEKFH